MRPPLLRLLFASFSLLPTIVAAELPTPPKVLDDRLTVELVALEPELRTPTAVACDEHGRVWVLENNTHFRPQNYDGPSTDRIVLLEDFAPDGRARKATTWADGFRDGMGLLSLPGGDLIVSTRGETIRLRDTDGDGKADQHTTLLKLETKTTYPHNGLSGIARGADRKVYVGLGENFGSPWVLKSADGTELHGADEGAIFRVNTDGTGLEWWALGVWNPFGLTAGKENQLFALDNDPGGGSLCRLLHVVPGGDYGFRFRYGRTVDHPFLSWFGQLPGTLPPMCLVGEAPCGMISYRPSGKENSLPAEYADELIGTTWSEHGLQRFPLKSKGSSFVSKADWFVRGGNDFRPSGIAQSPDGSLFISDWVDGSYELHGKGRVWRIRSKALASVPTQTGSEGPTTPQNSPEQSALNNPGDFRSINQADLPSLLRGSSGAAASNEPSDAFAIHRAILALATPEAKPWLQAHLTDSDPKIRLGVLLAYRRGRLPERREFLEQWLRDSDGAIRRAALQWISEEGIKDPMPKLDVVLEGQPTRATFEAYLAALQMLTSGKPDPKATVEQTEQVALDRNRAPELRALALRLLPPTYSELTMEELNQLLAEKNEAVRTEAVRMLAARPSDSAQAYLRKIAFDESANPNLRAEAIAGLALSSSQPDTQQVLRAAQSSSNSELVRLAYRSAGQPLPGLLNDQQGNPSDGVGNSAAGRRIFYHPNGPRCFTCHTVEGRGTTVGPDLTNLGRFTREELLDAIRQPSKEIAPAYAQWHVKTRAGSEGIGIDLFEDNKSEITLIDATAKQTKYKVADLVSREVLPVSMMPPGLNAMLTTQELRDLIAFLQESRD